MFTDNECIFLKLGYKIYALRHAVHKQDKGYTDKMLKPFYAFRNSR